MLKVEAQMKNHEKILKNLSKATPAIQGAVERHLKWAAPFMRARIVELASGPVVKRRTGRYASSIRFKIFLNQLKAIIGTRLLYARQLELGGTIRPKKSKAGLAIPTKFAKTKAGVSKKPRDYYETFFSRVDGRLFLFGKRTAKSVRGATPLFFFVRSVTQKPKGIFNTAFMQNKERIQNNAIRRISAEIEKVFGS